MSSFEQFLQDFPVVECLKILGAIVLAVALWVLANRVSRRYSADSGPRTTLTHALLSLFRVVLAVCVVLVILSVCGINVTSAVAGLGIASAIVGLALQDFLKDMIMGVHILSDRFFAVGDCVEIDGQEGIVRQFSMKTTKLELLADGSEVSLCNRNIERVRVLSHLRDIDLPLPYDSDPARAREVVEEIVRQIAAMDGVEEARFVGIQSFDESAILYKIRFFSPPEKQLILRRNILTMIREELHRAGMSIPYNQLDVHLDAPSPKRGTDG